jgi:hypothetical protein
VEGIFAEQDAHEQAALIGRDSTNASAVGTFH